MGNKVETIERGRGGWEDCHVWEGVQSEPALTSRAAQPWLTGSFTARRVPSCVRYRRSPDGEKKVVLISIITTCKSKPARWLHDLGDHIFLNLISLAWSWLIPHRGKRVRKQCQRLTSMSSKLSCWLMQRRTFFLLVSCISPAINNSSRIK